MPLLSPHAVAVLLILNVQFYGQEKGKKIARARISRSTFLAVAGRQNVRAAFLTSVEEELAALGWFFLQVPDGGFALFRTDAIEGWTKVSSKRVAGLIGDLKAGTIDAEDLANRIAGLDAEDDGDDGE